MQMPAASRSALAIVNEGATNAGLRAAAIPDQRPDILDACESIETPNSALWARRSARLGRSSRDDTLSLPNVRPGELS